MYAKFYTEEQMKNYTENRQKIEKAKLRKMKEEEETLDKISIEVFFMGNVKELKKVLVGLTTQEKALIISIARFVFQIFVHVEEFQALAALGFI